MLELCSCVCVCVTFVLTLNARYGIWLILFHMLTAIHPCTIFIQNLQRNWKCDNGFSVIWMLFLVCAPLKRKMMSIYLCDQHHHFKCITCKYEYHTWGILYHTITSNDEHKKILMIKSFGVDERLWALCFWDAVNSIQIIMEWNDYTSENFLHHRKVFIHFELMTLEN